MKHVTEPAKQVPVACEADVAVAGGGVSGMFAALAAARAGVKTVLVDRFGYLGGNMGPGVIAGGGLPDDRPLVGGLRGIQKEFTERVKSEGGAEPKGGYPDASSRVSYVALQMMKEAGVRLMLSTFIADPIMDGPVIGGIFVENKSGRQAVTAGVVIDATGDADLAFRAGAPVILQSDPSPPQTEEVIRAMQERYRGKLSDGDLRCLAGQLRGRGAVMGLWYAIGGVDCDRYESYVADSHEPEEGDLAWYRQTVTEPGLSPVPGSAYPFLHLIREAWEKGEFFIAKKVDAVGSVFVGGIGRLPGARDIAASRIGSAGDFDPGNGEHITMAEMEFRGIIYEWVQFLRRHVPGFESAHLFAIAPFLGARGGRFIAGDYTIKAADMTQEHKLFDDVVYTYNMGSDSGKALGVTADVPYRILLPRGVEGMLATGRSASYGRVLRSRLSCMVMGQVGGAAAALCVRENVSPRQLDVKRLQRQLLADGFYLGDQARLQELGLAPA